MKRILFSLLAGIALLASPVAKADNVTVEQARDAAAHYLQHNTKLSRITPEQLTLVYQWNNETLGVPSMYVFSAPEEGWIIMAATTVMDPVVAYTDENVFEVGNMAPPQEVWLNEYNQMVCDIQNVDAEKSLGDSPKWTVLANHGLKGTKESHILLTTKWNQGEPVGDDYNIFCPVINDSVAPTGCVATALAQVCNYYGYPKKPQGRVNYWNSRGSQRMKIDFDTVAPLDYSLMPIQIKATTPREYREEASRLAYYVGLSVKMQYGPDLSGAMDNDAVLGMKNNMKYSLGTIVNRRSSAYADTHYLYSLRRELVRNRPTYMSGVSSTSGGAHSGGHAWVCDGYKDEDTSKYHMNWGWGGKGNAFYNLVTNDMAISGQPYNFKNSQLIIVGMIPPQDSTDRIVGVVEVEDVTVLGRPYPNPATLEVVLPYSTSETAELQVYNISGRLVESLRVQAGDGEVVLRVDALPAGIYIYRMGEAHGKFVVR